MKQLTCEMCGSTDLLKQDGVFVCQTCGTKYSVEEAKKMMGGVVEVTGTVRVDTTSKLSNLYEIARRSRDDNNTEKAAQYYDMILQEDPMSWEASFYTTYYSAMQTNIAGISGAAIKVSNCIDTVLKLIRDNVPDDGQLAAVMEVCVRVTTIASLLYNAATGHYEGINSEIRSKYTQEYVDRLCRTRDLMYNMGNQIERIWGGSEQFGAIAVTAWKDGISKHKKILWHLADKVGNENVINSYAKKIGKYEPKYLENHDKEAIPARIRDIDLQINKLKRGRNKASGVNKFIGIIAIIYGLFRMYSLSTFLMYADETVHLAPTAFILPVLLIACGVVLCIGMKGSEPWRKALGGAALVWGAYSIFNIVTSNIPLYLYNILNNYGPVLILLLTGVQLIKQKFDPDKAAANERQLENLENEKADLEKKLADMG